MGQQKPHKWHFQIGCVIGVVVAMMLCMNAHADKVGINFVGGSEENGTPAPIRPDELAGAFPQRFWNNADSNNGSISPVGDDEQGASVTYGTFTVSWSAFQTNSRPAVLFLGPGFGTEGPPDYRLGLGYLDATDTQPATVTLEGIPNAFAGPGHTYSLIVYFIGNNLNIDRVNKFTITGANLGRRTIYGLDSGNPPTTPPWRQVPATSVSDRGSQTPEGNYVRFSGLTDLSLTLTATGGFATDNQPQAAINAIQIVLDRNPTLLNGSARGRVGVGDDVLIAGFVVGTDQPQMVAFRALGPSLPVQTRLIDPLLQVFDSSGNLLATNDNWVELSSYDQQLLFASGLAPPDTRESAVVALLPPGPYTAIVSGVAGATGVALAEFYSIP